MGQRLALGWEQLREPDVMPDYTKPPTFDPVTGFKGGRRPREMGASWDDMESMKLETWQRDYCAHKYIELQKCSAHRYPLTAYFCWDLMHAWHNCELQDLIMRMKEFERERRLLKRMKRKRLAAENPAAIEA